MHHFIVGVDVSKQRLDVCGPGGAPRQIANQPAPLAAFAQDLAQRRAFVVFEATGRYSWPLRDALEAAGVAHHSVNPARARHFARACGIIGKTDRVDAQVLRAMGAALDLPPSLPPGPGRRQLKALATRRRQLVDMKTQEKIRLHEIEAFLRQGLERHISQLAQEIAALDAEIARVTRRDPDLAAEQALLLSAPGGRLNFGPVVVAGLASDLAELGHLDRRRIAALAGLAPIARDSGARTPARSIGGGRPYLRSLLYLAGLQASRRCPRFIAFRARLEAAGKTAKQAIIAVARKLLTILNAMLRTGKPFDPKAV